MRHASDAARNEEAVREAVREVVDRMDTNGPRFAALAPYDRFVVASAAAVAVGVPSAAQALLYEARNALPPSEAAALDRLLAVVEGIVDARDCCRGQL